jgi:FkbH-like protein
MTDSGEQARRRFEEMLEHGETARGIQAARGLLTGAPGLRQWTFIRRAVERVGAERLGLRKVRVALLSSFSIEFIHDTLVAQGFLNELDVEIYQAGFAQFRQEILDPASGLYASKPQVVVLALDGPRLFPFGYGDYLQHMGGGFDQLLDGAEREIEAWLAAFRKQSDATVLIHNFAPSRWRPLGILDNRVGLGQGQLVTGLNERLNRLSRAQRGVYVVDYAGLVSRIGSEHWHDDRMDHYAQAPIAQSALPMLATEYMKYLRALTGKTRKCVALDLDNTLWGGVVGEIGATGIELGPQYPGSAFMAFQRAVLDLSRRGILLALASKNNEGDVREVFATNPHMVLKPEHFAHMEIHWGPKSQSLEAIARKLNIGLEHMVFVDDSPIECEQVRSACPVVTVIQLPKQPEQYVRALLEEGLFDGLGYSEEDGKRAELYQQRAQAEAMMAQSGSLDEFLRNLETEVVLAPVDEASLARAAQLTQKTNQFTTTTRRYTEAEMSRYAADPAWSTTAIRVRDRFGDNGIVGVMLARQDEAVLDVDSFLLSCRVIGRKVETVMLAHLCDQAEARAARRLRGRIIPTKKNEPVRDLYARHGFQRVKADDASGEVWELDLEQQRVEYPQWLAVVTPRVSRKA